MSYASGFRFLAWTLGVQPATVGVPFSMTAVMIVHCSFANVFHTRASSVALSGSQWPLYATLHFSFSGTNSDWEGNLDNTLHMV